MKKMLLIVPSRGRQEKIIKFKEYFDKNTTIADLCIGIDEDEVDKYPRFNDVIYDINPNMKLGPKLNAISSKFCKDYEYIAFMGDDHWIKTYAWDKKLLSPLKDIRYGMSYGNDLIQGERLPTAVVINSEIISRLGYMCPPNQEHLYLDDFWLMLGTVLGTIHYVPDVIIEHMHFSVGKSDNDEIYSASNAPSLYESDLIKYQFYLSDQFPQDLMRLKG